MRKTFTITMLLLFFIALPSTIYASYRMPFADNVDWMLTQTWHPAGNYLIYSPSQDKYIWTSGPNYALDFDTSSSTTPTIISPEKGVIKYIEKCTISANLVIDHNGYEIQYYHLDKSSVSGLQRGDIITKGQVLGSLSNINFNEYCGRSAASHLHMRFQTVQGDNDLDRKCLSGFRFEKYDYGSSSCVMKRGTGTTACLYDNFKANEQPGNQIININGVTLTNVGYAACGNIQVQSSIISPSGGDVILKSAE